MPPVLRTPLGFLIVAVSVALIAQAHAAETVVLKNRNGLEAHIIDTGAIIQRLIVPDVEGQMGDIVAGFIDANDYNNNTYSPYFGAVVGRVANRIENATFELDNERYEITANDNGNALHGGESGWSVKTWNMTEIDSDQGEAVRLVYISPDGDEGFPSTVVASVTYTLTENNELLTEFEATSDGPTPISLAQHSYFNLDVPGTNKTILDHEVYINGSYITPVDALLIPTGDFEPVEGTPFDFETPNTIGSRINEINSDPIGYDINYVLWGLNGSEARAAVRDCNTVDEPQLAAIVSSPYTGRVLEVMTQAPGMQFYTGNWLNGSVVGKFGAVYPQYGMFAMETQAFPNFVNEPNFPTCILRPDSPYKTTTAWRFTVQPIDSEPAVDSQSI